MMKRRQYPHPSIEASDAKLSADTRKIINDSLKLLREPAPDSFLGRRTHKAFPEKPREPEK
ncbi:hypothetical protein [Bradyrhizobium sp. Gha]|uniref:hypothetical protein n=1 Tax=Bradyrhizobium sp. Gha TaxID=1855318 RepID=UPI0008ED0183|nr:hypothetical protein [Bradyrhizobium sp. Gha]SFH80479.1 hypothetical protein SAMN05216525_10255 [Bradyrhizobium sp. Gha]